MPLPENFVFSQSSLQDFTDCRRRFQLHYLERVNWPALEAEPVVEHERRMRQGALFHRMTHQQIAGVDSTRMERMAHDEDLRRWWTNYIASAPYDLPGQSFPELFLSGPLGLWRAVAKIDLLVISPNGRVTILDWKTSQKRPPRSWVEKRLQTRMYRYIVTTSAAGLSQAAAIEPEAVEMVYWYADFPDEPERFTYNKSQYDQDKAELVALVNQIDQLEDGDFFKTSNKRHCRFCPYRSLCDRGTYAGQLDDLQEAFGDEDAFEFDINFEQIAEIEF